ncbi:rhodanese-like/PpiC domain-containing protein 12, chloroplastic isoform X1 [Olea europaea var. sylvestris]|uniref:rhodanese-like/PpiC domain-containing protein 12, chloroplastic isoform X1 n=1 Tax=Olea europaea var. sylvestris TaxID=158386 RepID=UPI000C1D1FFC|nr:rhodanese-like/PpiC domain-containing protein 12, chloroplastic isoform X1 [Olea europaea var. sylvestris]
MLRASSHHLQPILFTAPAPLFALLPTLTNRTNVSFALLQKSSIFHPNFVLTQPIYNHSYCNQGSKFKRVPHMVGKPCTPQATASFSTGNSSEGGREILVQHLLVKEDDMKLLLELQKRVAEGEDLSDLAVEYSICPSKEEGGMLGWVRKGQMVPEFEEAAFSAPLNKVVGCKTKFGWHLLQVLSEREESNLEYIKPIELHEKIQHPSFLEEAQLIDVREPEEVAQASLPGFTVLPLRQFSSWGPEIMTKFDPQKDTYVLCHHGMRSLQVAKWLQTQGFKKVFNVIGGIHEYAVKADPSIPTY